MGTKRTESAAPADAPASTASAPQPAADGGDGLAGAINVTATLTATPAPAPLPEKKSRSSASRSAASSASPSSSSGSPVERRRSPREKHIAPAVLQPPSGDASAEAAHGVTVQDLSLGGVGFRATEKFAPGETYRITLGKGPLLLNARVRIISCRQLGHRMYHVGAEFC
jgi:hypothetical protein